MVVVAWMLWVSVLYNIKYYINIKLFFFLKTWMNSTFGGNDEILTHLSSMVEIKFIVARGMK